VSALALLALALGASPPEAALVLSRAGDEVRVASGPYRFAISATAFDVVHAGFVGEEQRLFPGSSSVTFLGSESRFGPPQDVAVGARTIDLRGWVDRQKNLYYVAHYAFLPGKPSFRLVLTLTDRHDPAPAMAALSSSILEPVIEHLARGHLGPGPFDPSWSTRLLSDWRLEIVAPGGHPRELVQHNSYSASWDQEPWVEVVSASGSPYQWSARDARLKGVGLQLLHDASPKSANAIVYHPMVTGTARLTALYTGFPPSEGYKSGRGVTYEVVDGKGSVTPAIVDQGTGPESVPLGSFDLGPHSVVRVLATGRGGPKGDGAAIAGALKVAPASGAAFDLVLGRREAGVLSDGPITFALKDFWEHHPISLDRTKTTIGFRAVRRPEVLGGGMGLTLETVVAMDGSASDAEEVLNAPPSRALPKGLPPADGSLAAGPLGARYDALLKAFLEIYPADLESQDSFGWRNWGDYQIGVSYTSKTGSPVEDWANLQYDLPYGLLLAWVRTGNPVFWRYAQASLRHLMDIDYVKFSPYGEEKLNNLVHRKGETDRAQSHVASEPIVGQGFAFRSLLLYASLTGEPWARDLAKEHIDRLAFYGVTRTRFALTGDRSGAWMLRGALAGAREFPKDGRYDYRKIADAIVEELLGYYREHGRLPGAQPVWQGQLVEGLAEYYDLTKRQDVADAIVGHVRFLLKDALREKPGGGFEFLYCTPEGGECQKDEWSGEYNYGFLWLGSIAAAYRISKDPALATAGDRLFKDGEAHLLKEAAARRWTSALAFPHLYLDTFGSR
jgi:hypothetical protein